MAPPRFIPWTPDEDKLLIEAVASCGAKICWKHVAKNMSGRDNKACRKRWIHSLDPKLRKGRWSTSEDVALLGAVRKYGKRWYEVAKDLPGRTDDQCAKRYKEAVDPSIRRDPWTKEEDDKLWEAFQSLGNRWHAISSVLNGRPAVHCRNRLQSLQRLRATIGSVEPEAIPQKSESPLDSSFLNFHTPSEMPSPLPTFMVDDYIQSPSTSSLSSWHPPTPPSDSSPSSLVMAVEALPIGPYSSAFVEEVVCSTTQDEAHHNVPQDFAFTTPACASGAFESDPRMFNYVADPILWGEFPSQQPWASIPSTQVSQAVTSPPIQDHDESDRRALPVESNDHSLLPCPGIQDTADVITDDVSDGC